MLTAPPDGGYLIHGSLVSVDNQPRFVVRIVPVSKLGRPLLTGLRRTADGKFSLTIAGKAGRNYRVETSEDLARWTSLLNVTAVEGGLTVEDDTAANLPRRFYRAIEP